MTTLARRPRFLAAVLVVVGLAAGALAGRAATAANTVPAGRLGQGSAAATPYSISNVAYTLNGNSPQNIDLVAFSISPTNARVVKARLYDAGPWYSCTNTAGSVTCPTTSPQGSAATAATLTIVAGQ